MNMKIITLIALALGCLAVFGIIDMSDDSDASIVDPSTGTQIGDFYYTFSGSDATVVGISSSISSATSITIPDTVESGGTTYTVTTIYSPSASSGGIFREMTSLQTLVLPDSLVTIGRAAFNGCSALEDISLPSGLKTIGWSAFNGCSALTDISLPSGLVTIDGYAFTQTGLTSVTIPDTVTSLGLYVFKNCSSLASVVIGDSVVSISEEAFYGCTSLASVVIGDSVVSIEKNAFNGCTSLALTSLPSGLTSIEQSAFTSCTSLALTSLPSGLTSIGVTAFSGCTSLETLSIPLATTTIGNGVFLNCTNLILSLDISVTAAGDTDTVQWVTGLSSGNPTYVVTAPATYNNLFLTNWTYDGTDYNGGDNITMTLANRSITANVDPTTYGTCGDDLDWVLYADYNLDITGTGAMYDYTSGSPAPWNSYATSIVSLDLSEGMTTYGDYAFYGCTGLSGILTIPSAITHVGDSAFYDCGYSAMIIEGSPTLTDVSDPTFGSSDDHSFLEVLNLGDTVIEAGQYGLPDDAVVSDCIPLLGYVAPTSITETVQREGAAYDLMKIIPVIIILAVLVMAATAVIKRY